MPRTPLLVAVTQGKCPQCRRGKIFKYQSLLPGKFDVRNEHCSNCNLRFEKEPAFFIGARYVAYAFMVAIFVTFFVAFQVLFPDSELWIQIAVIVGVQIITAPWVQRESQILYLYLFGDVKYKPELDK